MSKKERVANEITGMLLYTESVTINQVYRHINGSDVNGGIRWHKPLFRVSKSTIRRAFYKLGKMDDYELYYPVGDCFDALHLKGSEIPF